MKKRTVPCTIAPAAAFATPKRNARQAADHARWGFHRPTSYVVAPAAPAWHGAARAIARGLGLV